MNKPRSFASTEIDIDSLDKVQGGMGLRQVASAVSGNSANAFIKKQNDPFAVQTSFGPQGGIQHALPQIPPGYALDSTGHLVRVGAVPQGLPGQPGAITPYQQAQIDLQRQQLENQRHAATMQGITSGLSALLKGFGQQGTGQTGQNRGAAGSQQSQSGQRGGAESYNDDEFDRGWQAARDHYRAPAAPAWDGSNGRPTSEVVRTVPNEPVALPDGVSFGTGPNMPAVPYFPGTSFPVTWSSSPAWPAASAAADQRPALGQNYDPSIGYRPAEAVEQLSGPGYATQQLDLARATYQNSLVAGGDSGAATAAEQQAAFDAYHSSLQTAASAGELVNPADER